MFVLREWVFINMRKMVGGWQSPASFGFPGLEVFLAAFNKQMYINTKTGFFFIRTAYMFAEQTLMSLAQQHDADL